MNCRPCGGSAAALRPTSIDINNGEEKLSDGVNVPVPVPREREFGARNP